MHKSSIVFHQDKVMSYSDDHPEGRELVDFPRQPNIPPVLAERSLLDDDPQLAAMFAELYAQSTRPC